MKKKIKRIGLGIALIIILCIATVVFHSLGYFRYPWEQEIMVVGAKPGTLPDMDEEDLREYLQKEADESKVSIQLNSRPVVKDGQADLMIQNPQYNLFDMEVSIFLCEGEERQLIYESGKIQPGYYIDYAELMIALPEGVHEATAYVTFYNGTEQLNTASIGMDIVVNE